MPKALENDLSQLPQFTPPISFRDQLRRELLNTSQPSQSRHPLKLFGFSLAVIVCAILIVIGMQSRKNPFTPQTVSAAEIIQVFLQSHFIPDTVLHRQMYQFEGNKSDYQPNTGRYFDIWQDQNSDRFFQKVVVPGQATEIQGHNLEFTYHIRPQENRILLFPSNYAPGEKEVYHGGELDITQWMNQLLDQQALYAYLGTDQNRSVYIINDTRQTQDKFWDTYYFDAETKRLIATEKEQDGFFNRVDFITIESLDRSPENLSLFDFPPKDVDIRNLPVFRETINRDTGYNDFIQVYPPDYLIHQIEQIDQDISIKEELLEEEIIEVLPIEADTAYFQDPISNLSLLYPSKWAWQTASDTTSSFTQWSYLDLQPLNLSSETNLDPTTNAPYPSIKSYLGEGAQTTFFNWPNNITGEYISDNYSTQYIFFNPTKTHILKLKMNIDDSSGVPRGERELIINSAQF